MNSNSVKPFLPYFLIAAIGVIAISVIIEVFVNKRPEVSLAKNYIQNCKSIEQEFGNLTDVRYVRYNANVTITTENTSGSYDYTLVGSKKSGTVRVYWTSEGSGVGFGVSSYKIIQE